MILKGDLKGFKENFETKDRIPPAVSGPDGENTAHSRNQSDCRICRIPPAHELRKKKGKISDCRTFSYSKTVSGENFLSVTLGSLRTLCTRSAKRTTLEFFHFLESLEDCK